LPVLLLLFSGSMKLIQPEGMAKGFADLGWPMTLATALGIVEIGSTILYVIPQTSVLGAILLTGYLGGAVATHARLEQWQFLAPLGVGILVWLGLCLRDGRLWSFVPLRR
jgi:uncharacterized membrane protein YphA (DoxX/SURF4 family)